MPCYLSPFLFHVKIRKALKNSDMESTLNITGIAQNGKGCTLLVGSSGKVYYIDKLESWDSMYLGKKIEVTGILEKESFQEEALKNEKGEWSGGIAGIKLTILNAKWCLIENK